MGLSPSFNTHTKESFNYLLYNPPHKPEIAQILDLIIIPEVIGYTLFESSKGLSYEGARLTGLNLSIEVQLNEKLTYLSYSEEQSIHSVHHTHLKGMLLTLPLEIHGKLTSSLIETSSFTFSPSVEAIYTKLINPRTVHKCGLLCMDIIF